MKKITISLALVILALAARADAQPVTWTNASGVSVSGNNLTKTGSGGSWDAGASSVEVIRDGYGYVEFTATEANLHRMCGLSYGDGTVDYAEIDFALHLNDTGSIGVYENGVIRSTTTYAANDRFRVEVVHGVVRYRRNGTVFYTSLQPPRYPLRVDASLHSTGATLTDVRVGNLVWSGEVGVSIANNTITKTGAAGWNSGAASANVIAAGDGYVEFSAGQNTTSRVAGLANGDAGQTLADVEFGIHLRADGIVTVVESGNSQGDFGGYIGSDRFRVEVQGGVVRYLKNGGLFYTSTLTPAYPLRADTAFETAAAVLQDLLVENLIFVSATGVDVAPRAS